MFGSTSLEVATGLIFIFLLLSILVTSVGELIASLLDARAKCLWKGVAALLESSSGPGSAGLWTTKLYAHPLLRALSPLEAQGKEADLGPKGSGPSYIPAKIFASALLDVTGATSAEVNTWQRKLQGRLAAILPADPNPAAAVKQVVEELANEIAASLDGAKLKGDLEKVVADLTGAGAGHANAGAQLTQIAGQISGAVLGAVRQQLLTVAQNPNPAELRKIIGLIPTAGPESAAVRNGLLALLERMPVDSTALGTAKSFAQEIAASHAHEALAALDNPDLRGALLNLLDQAGGDVAKLRTNVEAWFNHSMERVQGWYKRQTLWVHLCIAVALTILMNVDALVVLRHLSADPALRQSLLAQADDLEKHPSPVIASQIAKQPAAESNGNASTPAAPVADQPIEQAVSNLKVVRGQLLVLGLPIGWNLVPKPAANAGAPAQKPAVTAMDEYRTLPSWGLLLGLRKGDTRGEWSRLGLTLRFHCFGWLISIIAASLGAPFWFDLLTKFMNLRSTGKPPEKPAASSAPGAKP